MREGDSYAKIAREQEIEQKCREQGVVSQFLNQAELYGFDESIPDRIRFREMPELCV